MYKYPTLSYQGATTQKALQQFALSGYQQAQAQQVPAPTSFVASMLNELFSSKLVSTATHLSCKGQVCSGCTCSNNCLLALHADTRTCVCQRLTSLVLHYAGSSANCGDDTWLCWSDVCLFCLSESSTCLSSCEPAETEVALKMSDLYRYTCSASTSTTPDNAVHRTQSTLRLISVYVDSIWVRAQPVYYMSFIMQHMVQG